MVELMLLFMVLIYAFGIFNAKCMVYAFYGGFFLLNYGIDGAITFYRGALYFSPAFYYSYIDVNSYVYTMAMANACLLIYTLMYLYFLGIVRCDQKVFFEKKIFFFDKKVFLVIGLPLIFIPAVYKDVVSGIGFEILLSNRQLFFSDNIIAQVLLYFVPACCVVAFFVFWNSFDFLIKTLSLVLFVVLAGITLLSGSRSSFVLSVVMPIFMYLFYEKTSNLKGGEKYYFFGLLSIAVFVLLQLSSFYRDKTRGEQDYENLFVSPDVVSFDSSAFIVDSNITGVFSYLSAVTFLVPRSFWPNKPESGNVVYSSELFGDRLMETGAEMTASIIGEAYINFWYFGIISSAVILLGFTVAAKVLLSSRHEFLFLLGLMIFFRGSNIIRGDLLNTLLPIFFSALAFFVLKKYVTGKKYLIG